MYYPEIDSIIFLDIDKQQIADFWYMFLEG